MRVIALAACLTLAAGAGFAQPRPSFTEKMGAVPGARFAVVRICLPAVRDGAAPDAALFKGLVLNPKPAYPGQTTYWVGPKVTVSTNGRTCTVRSIDGKAEALREAVLSGLKETAGEVSAAFDNGPDDRDGAGRFRQERHCFALGGRTTYMVMSTSPDRGRIPLQATFGPGGNTPCASPSPAAPGGRP